MSYGNDDLTPLLAPPPQTGLGFRQGTVLTWNQQTAENTIAVGGAVLANVPILNTSESQLLGPGAVVGLLTAGPTWFILGRVTVPGTAQAATALQLVSSRMVSAEITAQGSRSSSAFGDLSGTTVGPSVPVTVSSSGKALVFVGASLGTGGGTYSGGLMSFTVSGATSRSASIANSLEFSMTAEGFAFSGSRGLLVSGLNAGDHTFTAKYASAVNGLAFTAENRNIVVFAL